MTVEIVFALVSGSLIAVAVYLFAYAAFGIRVGAVLAGVAGVARVVHVLFRFDRGRRLGR